MATLEQKYNNFVATINPTKPCNIPGTEDNEFCRTLAPCTKDSPSTICTNSKREVAKRIKCPAVSPSEGVYAENDNNWMVTYCFPTTTELQKAHPIIFTEFASPDLIECSDDLTSQCRTECKPAASHGTDP
eukprot:220890_1